MQNGGGGNEDQLGTRGSGGGQSFGGQLFQKAKGSILLGGKVDTCPQHMRTRKLWAP